MPFIVWLIIVIAVILNIKKSKSENKAKKNKYIEKARQNNIRKPQTNAKPNVNRPVMAESKSDVCGSQVHLNERDTFSDAEHPKLEQGVGIIAGRSEDWHSPSAGNKIVTCHYCGAYNQVPARRDGMFKCYFCWRKL